jgi:hypothetical protein
MGQLFNELKQDILYQHGIHAWNCGLSTAVWRQSLMTTLPER